MKTIAFISTATAVLGGRNLKIDFITLHLKLSLDFEIPQHKLLYSEPLTKHKVDSLIIK